MSHQSDPARYSQNIVNDVATVAPFSSIYVGVTGNIRVRKLDGTSQDYLNVPAGFILPVWGDMCIAAGTTATSLVAQWS